LPQQAPETASITPITPPPATAAPPPPPVSADAKTAVAPTPAGLRLTFAPGQADLSPESAASIKQFAAAAPAGGGATFNVQAYAPGSKDDPSSARRLSLSRAMAVRSALVSDGVESARIFVRALGSQYGSGPADRVDIDVMGDNAAASR
ncbi:MAG TPA: OmpA family protein, partial [Rhodopila sp.]|uniref:OmpA family protein n=1 Tax=Rhodopila sp. TaxID=2480087 RepID=UPI002C9BFF67